MKERCPVCGRVATFYPDGSFRNVPATGGFSGRPEAVYIGHFRAHQADKGVRCPGGGNSITAQHCAADQGIAAAIVAIVAFARGVK